MDRKNTSYYSGRNPSSRKKAWENCLVKLLRTIGFIDAFVSIATLHNTLIMVNSSGDEYSMFVLSAITSGIIMLVILALSVFHLIKSIQLKR